MSQDAVVMLEGTIYEDGYGLIANKVMRDREIDPVAKSIYAYLCSFAGVGKEGERSAFPGVSLMMAELGIKSEDTFYKYRKQLVQKGYIKIEKRRKEGAKFESNLYKIVAVPVETAAVKSAEEKEKSPHPKKSGTVSPYPKFSSTEISSTENQGTIINSSTINSSTIEEEEYILRARAENIAYDILNDFLRSKQLDQVTINQIIKRLIEKGIDLFLMKDAENQYKHMMDKLRYGEIDNHNGFAKYFADGLQMRTVQSSASRQYQEEKLQEYEAARERSKQNAGVFYNWLEA